MILKFLPPVALWFVANALATYYSKRTLKYNSLEEAPGFKEKLHLAMLLSFLQLSISGIIGALIQRKNGLFAYVVEAREKKHPAYVRIMLTALFNAIGSTCVNVAYIQGSVSLVQVIKTLEPVTTYILSIGILKTDHSLSILFSIIIIVIGAAYTSWKDSTCNYASISIALISNFMMPLRNVMMKANEESSNEKCENKLNEMQPSGFIMFSVISAIGSFFIGWVVLVYSSIEGIPLLYDIGKMPLMLLSSISFFGYNGASFIVLHMSDPLTHGVLNVLKRFFNIFCNIAVLHTDSFSKEIAKGLIISFFGMVLFTLSKNKITKPVMRFTYLMPFLGFCSLCSIMMTMSFGTLESVVLKVDNQLREIHVVPFDAYKYDSIKHVEEHRTCAKLIIPQSEKITLDWVDQPFQVIRDDNIDRYITDDMLCLQLGSTVGLIFNDTKPVPSESYRTILKTLQTTMMQNSNDVEFRVADRKVVALSGWYQLASEKVIEDRKKDGNCGNFVWQYGATRMIHPYTTKFVNRDSNENVSALVMATANALQLDGNLEEFVNSMKSLVMKFDKPTTMLGIGIQGEFSDFQGTGNLKLHQFQVDFFNEIAKRSTGKSVSVRGEYTEAACVNSGVDICQSLGCPSLTISRSPNLGQVLETKWNEVLKKLIRGDNLKIGIGLPAMKRKKHPEEYAKIIDMFLSVCRQHDCYFIYQMHYDSQVETYAREKGKKIKSKFFREGVEDWFEFMRSLDFMISTRIHGDMAAVVNEVPSILIATDLRIAELLNAMKLPHLSLDDDVIENSSVSLNDLMTSAVKDFKEFEENRRHRLISYRKMLQAVGLDLDPSLSSIIRDGL